MSNDFVKQGYEKAADDYAMRRNQFESIKYLEAFTKLVEKVGFKIVLNKIDSSGNEKHQILIVTIS